MFVGFLYELRRRKVPVGTQEAVALAQALRAGLHDSSLEGFYEVARALLIHNEAHLDAFDQAFLAHFKGVEDAGNALLEELLEWLEVARATNAGERTPEEAAALAALEPEALRQLFEARMHRPQRRPGEGNGLGTAGTQASQGSGPRTDGGEASAGTGGRRGAMKTADARLYRGYRDDRILDTRSLAVALRKLRAFQREGALDELDLEATIDATAKNAGELEVVLRAPRKPNTRVLLLMDVGGSMTPHAHLVSRLFSAARKATHFRELRTHYFHNCVYGSVYRTEGLGEPVTVPELLGECGPHWKLVVVGDALMAPYELMLRSGAQGRYREDGVEGVVWMMQMAQHFERSAWLNPEPPASWWSPTIRTLRSLFPMFPLTVEGLGEAVGHLTRGGVRKGARVTR
ncbi:MAG: VWA domain-containing protein [Myxococcaceae bacterium]